MTESDFPRVSVDIPTLAQHLNAQDPVALVIRAHLYIEAALIRLIEAALVRREALDLTRVPFVTKVGLAVALGRVDPKSRGAYTALNRLRRRFAHDLDTQLREQDKLDLYNNLSNKQRQFADALRKTEMPFMGRLRCDLMALIIHLEAAANKITG